MFMFMFMADVGPGSRPGQANGSGDVYANLPKLWQSEILATFDQEAIADKLFPIRQISNGKSAEFRRIGQGSVKFHAAGENIVDTANSYESGVLHNVVSIALDRPLVAHESLDLQELGMINVPEAMRMEISQELGRSLARQYDQYALQKLVMAARESATITGGPTGGAITDADADSNAESLIDSIQTALQYMDEDNIPMEDRYIVLRPAQYRLLMKDRTNLPDFYIFDKDLGGSGSLSKGIVGDIGGAKVLRTNHLPSTDLSSAITGDKNDYSADFSTTVAAVFHKGAIGGVRRGGMKVAVKDRTFEQYALSITAIIEQGFDTLRPEAAVEIKTA